jgi:hypothetical protein
MISLCWVTYKSISSAVWTKNKVTWHVFIEEILWTAHWEKCKLIHRLTCTVIEESMAQHSPRYNDRKRRKPSETLPIRVNRHSPNFHIPPPPPRVVRVVENLINIRIDAREFASILYVYIQNRPQRNTQVWEGKRPNEVSYKEYSTWNLNIYDVRKERKKERRKNIF